MTTGPSRINRWRALLYLGVLGHVWLGVAHLTVGDHAHDTVNQVVFQVGLLVGFPLLLGGIIRWFDRRDRTASDHRRLVLWGVSGTIGTLLLLGIVLLDITLAGVTVAHGEFDLIIAADVGALFGVIGGIQAVRVRTSVRRAERAEARAELSRKHEESLAFLHRILRHHVLNGASVIIGEARRVEDSVDADPGDSLETIRRRGEEMVEYVDDIRTVLTALSGDIPVTRVNLTAVIESELESARYAFPEADFEVSVPEDVTVLGSELLGVAIENLLENAVKHTDDDSPSVSIDVAEGDRWTRVTVADEGPGMSDTAKSAYFSRGSHGRESLGEGLGLYLAESVVGIAEGRIWIEDNEPRGTRVVMELPRPPRRDVGVDVAAKAGSLGT